MQDGDVRSGDGRLSAPLSSLPSCLFAAQPVMLRIDADLALSLCHKILPAMDHIGRPRHYNEQSLAAMPSEGWPVLGSAVFRIDQLVSLPSILQSLGLADSQQLTGASVDSEQGVGKKSSGPSEHEQIDANHHQTCGLAPTAGISPARLATANQLWAHCEQASRLAAPICHHRSSRRTLLGQTHPQQWQLVQLDHPRCCCIAVFTNNALLSRELPCSGSGGGILHARPSSSGKATRNFAMAAASLVPSSVVGGCAARLKLVSSCTPFRSLTFRLPPNQPTRPCPAFPLSA